MGTSRQIYHLQEIDIEVEAKEQSLQQVTRQLGDNQAVVKVQARLEGEKQNLEEFKGQQHSAEWAIDDLSSKLSKDEEELYSGRIKNPKELTSLQHEFELMKSKRNQLEDNALAIMDKVEQAEANVAAVSRELKAAETEWQRQQQQLSAEMEQLKKELSDLTHRRESLLAEIDPQVIELYYKLRKQRKQAVAKVEQGICGSCRISLPITDLQQVRSGKLVQCSSCGRILFQA